MTPVWQGERHNYPIPERFAGVRIRKDGWPDMRQALAHEMVAFFRRMDDGPQLTMDDWRRAYAAD